MTNMLAVVLISWTLTKADFNFHKNLPCFFLKVSFGTYFAVCHFLFCFDCQSDAFWPANDAKHARFSKFRAPRTPLVTTSQQRFIVGNQIYYWRFTPKLYRKSQTRQIFVQLWIFLSGKVYGLTRSTFLTTDSDSTWKIASFSYMIYPWWIHKLMKPVSQHSESDDHNLERSASIDKVIRCTNFSHIILLGKVYVK